MKTTQKRWNYFTAAAALGVLALGLTVYLLTWGPFAAVSAHTLSESVDSVFSAMHQGNLSDCESRLYGSPELGEAPEENTPEGVLWQAYCQALSWTVDPNFRMDGSEAVLNVTVTTLDMEDFWSRADAAAPELAGEMARTMDAGQVYAAGGGYQETFSQQVFLEAVRAALPQTAAVQRSLPVHLTPETGRWRVIPTEEICQLLLCR